MILYLDASALVKRYVSEPGSGNVNRMIEAAEVVGTGVISRAEVAAALAKSVRVGILNSGDASISLQTFRQDWPDLVRVQVTEMVVARADALAWEYNLRGYDAVHLATAVVWQEAMGTPVTLITFDRQLWEAVNPAGLTPAPPNLPALLDSWKT